MSSKDVTSNNVGSTQGHVESSEATQPEKLVDMDTPIPIEIQDETNTTQDLHGSDSNLNKRLKSTAWEHFTRVQEGDVWKAICKYCKKKLGGETRNGTKHLHQHYKICPLKKLKLNTVDQSLIKTMKQSSGNDATSSISNYIFDQGIARKELAMMIILHEYPISIVEHFGFRRFTSAIQPLFKQVSRNTIKKEILTIYDDERTKTMLSIGKCNSKIALTTDMWTASNQKRGYMAITAHWIDEAWRLQCRILRFAYVPCPHTAEVMCDVLKELVMTWNLYENVSALTVDNCTTNDAMVAQLIVRLGAKSLPLYGKLFHVRCVAHILNIVVKDGLCIIASSIEKVRDSVAYWTATPKREEQFEDVVKQTGIPLSQKLCLDCKTRWNSTYLMLTVALKYRRVFNRLSIIDPKYMSSPSNQDWDWASDICDKLESFYNVTELVSGTHYPTSNLFFPKVADIKLALNEWLVCDNDLIRDMAKNMCAKFDKYWYACSGVMGVGFFLDPRYKMTGVEYLCGKMFGDEATTVVNDFKVILKELVDEYSVDPNLESSEHPSIRCRTSNSKMSTSALKKRKSSALDEFDEFADDNEESIVEQSDLDKYMGSKRVPRNTDKFDILSWWKVNGYMYPTLQKIARDFLAIPIATVASESAFSTGGRVISQHRSRLHHKTVEALMCAQDWLWMEFKGVSKFHGSEANIDTEVAPISVDRDVEIDGSSCLTMDYQELL